MANASILAAFERMWQHVTSVINDKSDIDHTHHIPTTVSLDMANWSGMEQIVDVVGVTDDNTVIITPSPTDRKAYCESDVYCSTQSNGKLTFECSKVPTKEITVNILIIN